MLLDRIDIDNHGPLTRVELGPFSEHLNVVCMPEGSGKTAIARFIRDSLVRREYPLGMMSSSAGRVVWADRNGKIHCRREQDGTSRGRRTVEFESRGDASHRFDWLHGSWIEGIADSTDASRALESIRIPESIVDGIVTDTAVTSISRVIQACLSSGLGDPGLFAGLPIGSSKVSGLSPATPESDDAGRRALRDELARVEAELAQADAAYRDPSVASTTVQARRDWLRSRLATLQSMHGHHASYGTAPYGEAYYASGLGPQTVTAELSQLHDRIWQLRVRHSELTRWLSHLQTDRNRVRYTAPITASPYAEVPMASRAGGLIRSQQSGQQTGQQSGIYGSARYGSGLELDQELRQRLLDVDAQILRWRRILAELSGLRQAIVSEEHRRFFASANRYSAELPFSEEVLRRQRMGYFLSSLDHYVSQHSSRSAWDVLASGPGSTRWPDEIDLRIEAIIRQIDSLAMQYDRTRPTAISWYRDLPSGHAYRGINSLVQTLRTIRDDLQNVRRYGFRFASQSTRREQDLFELQGAERWAIATIERLFAHRDSIVRDRELAERVRYPYWLDENYHRQNWSGWYIDHLDRETVARSRELDQINAELDRCLHQAAELRRRGDWSAVTFDAMDPLARQSEIDSIVAELQSAELQSAELQSLEHPFGPLVTDPPRRAWLLNRRAELIQKLGTPQTATVSGQPLADEASQWLVRLSGGRLRRVDWNPANFTTAPDQVAAARQIGFAKIDGNDEASCPAVDRGLAALAVRLAAGDLLARTGRPIPLVIEMHRELLRGELLHGDVAVDAAVVAALDDYAKSGRQIVVLASDPMFADQVARRGGKTFAIHGERIEHEHRPLWHPHYADETYAGPHAGVHLPPSGIDPLAASDAFVDRYYDQYFDNLPVGATLADINRNLDAIWQEAYGISPYARNAYGSSTLYPESPAVGPAHPAAMPVPPVGQFGASGQYKGMHSADGVWHDGYYFADNYTTRPAQAMSAERTGESNSPASNSTTSRVEARRPKKVSPFYLTVDSPIDQAPSVDAVAAARLRRLNVTHINHLMNQDPNRLADSLGLAGVTAATVRRWQSECRLVCHVPQLRGFDAKILVGCGITDAGHLAATDPIVLLDRVEAFLATERGQRILLSGTSYELSRITSWIAAANVNTDEDSLARAVDHRTVDGRVVRSDENGSFERKLDNDQYEYEFIDDNGEVVRATSNRSRLRRGSFATQRSGRSASGDRNRSARGQSTSRSASSRSRSERSRSGRGHAFGQFTRADGYESGETESGSRGERQSRSSRRSASRSSSRRSGGRTARSSEGRSRSRWQEASSSNHAAQAESQASESSEAIETELRFYLHRESPVVDAPSIGARMAERLEAVGIETVDDLLNADATELAEQLDHRRIDAEVITAWQNQAILVCRIPMLRGHDAQLLVAAEFTTPEEVAEYDADELFALIDPIARSNEGKRILRGGKLPDLDEITEWIHYAGLNRELIAA